ncbi:hypothetical protein M3Y94_00180600 [Aphelenchoides besseyi]|nr:hypothetical protein M3Y94_00180600 [Aphelenchoides besseyi]
MLLLSICCFVLAVQAVDSCAPTLNPPSDATSLELDSNVPLSNAADLANKLQQALANLNASKYGSTTQEETLGVDGNIIVRIRFNNKVDCTELREDTQKLRQQVPEIVRAVINCNGQALVI